MLQQGNPAREAIQEHKRKKAGRDVLFQSPVRLDVHTLEFEGELFLLDIKSCTLIAADKVARDILNLSTTDTEPQILDVLGSRHRRVEAVEALREFELLIDSGFLHKREEAPRHILPDSAEMNVFPAYLLSLGLVANCNMSCSYCFEKQGRGSSLKKMNPRMANRAFDWLLDRSGAVEDLYIRFFGGEPLLNFAAMESVASYAAAKAKRLNKDVAFLLNTNGTLIDETVLDFICKYQVGVCISLDGGESYHNIHRRFRNGHGSFEKVELGVRRLLKRRAGGIQAQAVLTRQTRDALQEMPHFFRDMGFDGVYVGFVDGSQNDSYSLSGEHLKALYGDYVNILESCMIESHPCRFNLSGHDKILRRLYRGEPEYYGCPTHAGINMFHVDPAGDIYPCYRMLSKELRLGNAAKEDPAEQADRIRKAFIDDNVYENECRKCWARHLCGGICPARSKRSANPAEHCSLQERMALNLGLYIRLWRKHRPLLDALYGTGV